MLLIRIVADIDLYHSVVDPDPPLNRKIHMFLGPTDPHLDPLVTPDPSIKKQK
jgi:hypothetical protein